MKINRLMSVVLAFTTGCAVLGQKSAEKPVGTHYSAAFINNNGKLIVFPFNGDPIAIDLPTRVGGMTFSASGRIIYGGVQPSSAGPPLAAVTIKPSGVRPLLGSNGFDALNSLTVDSAEDIAIVSATYEHEGAFECGLFVLDIKSGTVQKILDNLTPSCFPLSSWADLSASPDGKRVVGTAGRGQIGVVNIKERKIEKLWPGTAAWWSPDGKWIAALTFANHMEIELIRASDLSIQRHLGNGGNLRWSPDSRYLLVLDHGWCGLGSGYVGTLQTLDIETGERRAIKSSECKVNLMTTGWVSDEVLE